jgi:hypothetical protein
MPKFAAAIESDENLAKELIAKIGVARENKWVKVEESAVEVVSKVVEKPKKADKNKNEVV